LKQTKTSPNKTHAYNLRLPCGPAALIEHDQPSSPHLPSLTSLDREPELLHRRRERSAVDEVSVDVASGDLLAVARCGDSLRLPHVVAHRGEHGKLSNAAIERECDDTIATCLHPQRLGRVAAVEGSAQGDESLWHHVVEGADSAVGPRGHAHDLTLVCPREHVETTTQNHGREVGEPLEEVQVAHRVLEPCVCEQQCHTQCGGQCAWWSLVSVASESGVPLCADRVPFKRDVDITVACRDGGAHLRALRQPLQPEEQPDEAPAVAHWGEAVRLRALQLPHERQEQSYDASAVAHRGEALCLRALRIPHKRQEPPYEAPASARRIVIEAVYNGSRCS
jgi:hypothetical protein